MNFRGPSPPSRAPDTDQVATTTRLIARTISWSSFRATTSWAGSSRFGLAMMFFFGEALGRQGVDLGQVDESGTSGNPSANADELSITTQPLAAILGEYSFDHAPPADIRQISVEEKS